jgi:hypothetical protein
LAIAILSGSACSTGGTGTPEFTADTPGFEPPDFIDGISIPECVPNQPFPQQALFSGLDDMESYRYRALYQYKDGDTYAEGELAMAVLGAHSGGRVNTLEVLTIPFPSWIYPRSHIVTYDLHARRSTELTITEEGVWVSTDNEEGWVEYTIDEPNDLINVAEIFGPEMIFWMLSELRAQEDPQIQENHVELDGEDVIHYCWVMEGGQFLAHYFLDYRDLGTALNSPTIHIWVTELDRHLVRLALTGESPGAFYGEEIVHDTPHDFLYWLEILDINQEVTIEPPTPNEVILSFPAGQPGQSDPSQSTTGDIPVPEGAVEVDQETFDELRSRDIPREFINIPEWTLRPVSGFGQSISFFFPDYVQSIYETDMGVFEIANHYTDVLGVQGWDLHHDVLQLGELKFIVLFNRGNDIITLAITGIGEKAVFWLLEPDI